MFHDLLVDCDEPEVLDALLDAQVPDAWVLGMRAVTGQPFGREWSTRDVVRLHDSIVVRCVDRDAVDAFFDDLETTPQTWFNPWDEDEPLPEARRVRWL